MPARCQIPPWVVQVMRFIDPAPQRETGNLRPSKEAERDAGDPDTITHEQRIAVYHVNSAYVG
jgi:hypothetical protein